MFLFDIGLGLIVTVLISLIANLDPSISILAVGVAGSLLPDWDVLPHVIKKRGKLDQWDHKHRDTSHYPLITVPITGIIVGWSFGPWIAVILATTMTAHYLNDSHDVGWGIRWLYPVINKYYCYRAVGNEERKLHAWTPEEQDEVVTRYGNPNWHKDSQGLLLDSIMFTLGLMTATLWLLYLSSNE